MKNTTYIKSITSIQLERILVGMFFLVFSFFFVILERGSWLGGGGDSAFYVELLENITKTGYPSSNTGSAVVEFQQKSKLLTMEVGELSKLSFEASDYSKENAFKAHFMPIMYLMVPFVWIIGASWTWVLWTVISFLGMLLCLYIYLRKNNISVLASILFVFLISAHPAWNYSIQWQMYIDRFYLLLGLLMALTVDGANTKIYKVIIISIVCSMLVEKMILITGVFITGYALLNGNKLKNILRTQLVFWGILLITTSLVVIKFYLNNSYYDSFISLSSFTNFFDNLLINEQMAQNLVIFLLFNGLPLLAIGIFEWKAALLVFVLMIPNIFGSIGGAEKSGWSTHYHSTYFPILVWALAKGYLKISKLFQAKHSGYVMYTVVIVLIILLLGVSPFRLEGMKFSKLNFYNNAWYQSFYKFRDFSKKTGNFSYLNNRNIKISENVSKGVIVSAPESFWVPLYEGRKLYFYPLGMDTAEYVVLRAIKTDNNIIEFSGFISYIGEENAIAANKYLLNRMEKLGFDVRNPIIVEDAAIFKRLKTI